MPVAFPTVALIGKYKTPEVAEPVMRLARFLETRGVKVLLDRLTAAHIQNCPYDVLLLEELGREADLAIVIGGDGTMLNIARTFAPYDVALVGINQGRLGFLTDISLDTMFETITAILDGQFVTEERMLFESEVWSGNNGGQERVFEVLAFNDVVVAKGFKGGLVDIEVRIDGQFIYNQRSGRPDRCDAYRIDGLCAVLGRAHRASVAVSDVAGAGIPAHLVQSADRDQRGQRG